MGRLPVKQVAFNKHKSNKLVSSGDAERVADFLNVDLAALFANT